MSQSPAAYLRALDQTMTPGKLVFHEEYGLIYPEGAKDDGHGYPAEYVADNVEEHNARGIIALRNLLPELAAVVEAVDKLETEGDDDGAISEARAALVVAIAREAQSRGGRG